MVRVVLDTNVLVSAMLSDEGASFRLMEVLGKDVEDLRFQPCLSVPLVLEYESVLRRIEGIRGADVTTTLDYLCRIGDRREIYFLWRPFLRDPSDEMVLEVAVGARAGAIITHNVRDFEGVEAQFGIRALTPGAFLLELEEGRP